MLEQICTNETLLLWLLSASVISFVASLIIVPFVLARIPADYFSETARHRRSVNTPHFLLTILILILKNCVGLIFLFSGILMLALPGQGILTILVALIFLDFPGKYRLERKIIGNHTVLSGVNWVRRKAGKPELILEEKKAPPQRRGKVNLTGKR
ncbi:MAG: hypothetical protein GKR93_16390 [Gammaproteobacteria bacterium]|nr:hypothetical protein [Gammaproteobacteria bacterium]